MVRFLGERRKNKKKKRAEGKKPTGGGGCWVKEARANGVIFIFG